MLRITERSESSRVVRLRLDGTITGETVGELEEMITKHRSSTARAVILDMGGVTFMHETVAKKLAPLRSDSLQIINCSPFIAALLDSAKRFD